MPDYKKKKVKKGLFSNKRPSKNVEYDNSDIKMRPKQKNLPKKEKGLNVIKGKKLQRARKAQLTALTVIVLVLIIVITSLFMPINIFETVSNTLALVGKGGYPFEAVGSQVIDVASANNCYYILTDTTLNLRANSGKEVLNISHGFSSPVLKNGSGRAMLFDQGGKSFFIANLKEKLYDKKIDGDILNADIARNGSYVIAYTADNYASVVSVYNRNGKRLYEWHSAEETVNQVTISPNGKKIAVSTLTAEGGKLKSKLYVFRYDSANPDFSLDYGDKLIYSLEGGSGFGFTVLTKNTSKYISWSKYKAKDYSNDFELSMQRVTNSGTLLVYSRANNKSDNHIAVFNKSGKLVSEFNYDGTISDIQMSRGHIYCISDTVVSIFSKDGELLRQGECSFGALRLSVLSSYSVAVIRNDEVSRVEIKR